MKKQLITLIAVSLFVLPILAQDNVGIGTTNPHSSALLDLSSTSKGFLVPRVTLTAIANGVTPINNPAIGLMIYNTGGSVTEGFYYWNGNQWTQIGVGGSTSVEGCLTLDQAYNCNGSGSGRVINSNAGAVEINLTGGGNKGLFVTSNIENSMGIDVEQTNKGVSIRAKATHTDNMYPAIQAESNSSVKDNAAILGQNNGGGYGVSGQIPPSGTGFAAVFGNNLRTNGGSGVSGEGFNGVVGMANSVVGYGVIGMNSNPITDPNDPDQWGIGTAGQGTVGVMGEGLIGIYGNTFYEDGWSGYFTHDVGVEGEVWAFGFQQASDRRLKSNIKPIDNALDKIKKINGLNYNITLKNMIDGKVVETTKNEYGVIAQELELVFPQMVSEKAFLKSARDNEMYKTVNYIQLVPVLIEAVKELSNEIEQLKIEIEQLKK